MMDNQELQRIIESLLIVADAPVSNKQLREIIGHRVTEERVRDAVAGLRTAYEETDRAFTVSEVAEGFLLSTLPAYAEWIKALYKGRLTTKLSKPSLETLSIIAFKQPITRTDIESIRRVDCGGVLSGLLERKLIAISGRDKGPGKPLIYVTTQEFLRYFGLNRLSDLPRPKELEELLKERERQQTDMFDEDDPSLALAEEAADGESAEDAAAAGAEESGTDESGDADVPETEEPVEASSDGETAGTEEADGDPAADDASDGTDTPADEESADSRPEAGDPGESEDMTRDTR